MFHQKLIPPDQCGACYPDETAERQHLSSFIFHLYLETAGAMSKLEPTFNKLFGVVPEESLRATEAVLGA